MLAFLFAAAATYLFLEALAFTVEFLNADLAAKENTKCSYHIWPTEGPMICQRCRHNPSDTIASKDDFKIDEQ